MEIDAAFFSIALKMLQGSGTSSNIGSETEKVRRHANGSYGLMGISIRAPWNPAIFKRREQERIRKEQEKQREQKQ